MQSAFYFKMRMSSSDWELLSNIMVKDNPFYTRKAQRDWFFNQINRLCREICLPLLTMYVQTPLVEKTVYIENRAFDEATDEPPPPALDKPGTLVEKQVSVQVIPFAGSTNINILRDFASLKHTTITQIIQKYIVDARIVADERNRAKRYYESEFYQC